MAIKPSKTSKEHVMTNLLNCFTFVDTEKQLVIAYPVFLHLGYTRESVQAALSKPMLRQYTNCKGFAPREDFFISIPQIGELIVNAPETKYVSHILEFVKNTLQPLFTKPQLEFNHDNFKKDAIMKHEIITKQYNEKPISFELGNHNLINATEMAVANDKKINDFLRLQTTKEYLEELSSVTGIPVTDLVIVKQGGKRQGTWVHSKVAIRVAQWCNAKFAVQVDMWVEELMTKGSVAIEHPATKPVVKTEERTKAINASFLSYADKMIDRMKLNDNSKQVARANLLHELVGIPVEPMLPTIEHRLSAEEIAEKLGTSANMVGRIANLLKLKDDSDLCERRLSKSQYSNKEVEQCFYSSEAVNLIQRQLNERKAS